jgi:hypothetical protein
MIYSGNTVGLPLLNDNGNWRTANNLFYLQREAYSRYQHNSGKPISAISWLAYCYQFFLQRRPIELDKPHILASATEIVFLRLKE